jgi:hypothetical protein
LGQSGVSLRKLKPLTSPDFLLCFHLWGTYIRIKLKSGRWYSEPLPILTTGQDTFNLTDLYEAEICWKQCVDMCTDGAGKTRGFLAPVKAIALECTGSHIIVHHHAVAWKKFQTHSKWRSHRMWRFPFYTMKTIVFKNFCALSVETGGSYTALHAELRWLCRRQIFGSNIHTALRNVVVQCWPSFPPSITSLWNCMAPEF